MKHVYGYVRVSTVKQGERGVSLQEQRDAIARCAERNDLKVVKYFKERQTAAKRGRPVFSTMLSLLEKGEASGVVIHKIDRSARNLKDWADLGELIDRGIDVYFANENIDLRSRGGRLSADIQAVVAADFIRNLREETRKGFYGRLKQGLYPLRAPLGYRDMGRGNPKEPDPVSGRLVTQAFELYATGGFTLQSLAKELRRLGLKNRNGGDVSLNGLSVMLNNPFYAGLIHIKKTGETFQGVHEPLISVAVYERVQAVLKGKFHARSRRHDLAYRRLFKCSRCQKTLIGEVQKGHVYYRCHTKGCPTKTVREEMIEQAVRHTLSPVHLDDEEFLELEDRVSRLRGRWATESKKMLQSLELREKGLASRLDRLTDALLDGLIDKETFERRKGVLLRDIRAVKEKMTNITDQKNLLPDRLQQFLEQAKSLYLSYEMRSSVEKREMLRDITSNRLVSRDNIEITLQSPFRELADRMKSSHCDPCRDMDRTHNDVLFETILTYFEAQETL